jgi:hypothetical protein
MKCGWVFHHSDFKARYGTASSGRNIAHKTPTYNFTRPLPLSQFAEFIRRYLKQTGLLAANGGSLLCNRATHEQDQKHQQ